MERVTANAQQSVPHRPLGLIMSALEEAGFKQSFVYEDLVFVEYNAFLLRMEESGASVSLFFNVDSELDKREHIARELAQSGSRFNLEVMARGTYHLTADNDKERIDIAFFESDL